MFYFFDLQTKNAVNQQEFKIFPKKKILHGQFLPPYSICGLTLILGGIKKPKKGKI